jgi:hypothetical protein
MMGLKIGDVSPVGAAITGEGFASNFGLLPAMHARDKKKEKEAEEEERKKQSGMKKGGKVNKYAKGGDVTFLTKDRQEKADNSMKAQRMRERDSIAKGRIRDIESSKPGAPYYRADSSDTPDEAVVRAKGQGKYMAGEVGPLASKQDEGVLAPAARTLKNVMGGKRGEEATKDTDGDPYYKRRTREEGDKAVSSYRGAKENQKEYGMKKGGKVSSASARGDGCAQRGKTKGRMV